MALIDMIAYLPKSHKNYDKMLYLYQHLAEGIKKTQNMKDGMWYQLVEYPDLANNYPETSGTGMMLYALKKGRNLGLLSENFNTNIDKGWAALKTFVKPFTDGLPMVTSFCPGMGIQDNITNYLSVRPVSCPSSDEKQQPHGYFSVLMAASVLEF